MPQQTIIDLGKKVKAKYPGQYDDLSDMELGQRVKAKYPDAYGDFMDVGVPKGLPGPPIPPAVREMAGTGGPPAQPSLIGGFLSELKKNAAGLLPTWQQAPSIIGGMIGSAAEPGLGTAIGAGAGELLSQAISPPKTASEGAMRALQNIGPGALEGLVAQQLGSAAVSRLPNAARAGRSLQQVENAVGPRPIDINDANRAATEAMHEFNTGGGPLPDVIRKYLQDVKFRYDPLTGQLLNPMDYSTGRKFLSNAGRKLSADEVQKLTPVMARRLAQFRDALATSVRQPAANAGLGSLYDQAIVEYRRAKTMQDAQEILEKWLKRALVTGAALETGYEIYSRVRKH